MRNAVLVTSVLGVVMLLAVGLVAFVVLKGSSSGPAKADAITNASAKSTVSGKPTASAKSSKSAKAKKSAKPKASAKPTPSAKPTASRAPAASAAPSLLTVPAGWTLAFDPSFSGSALSAGTWATCYYWATTDGCNDNPATEKEWYLPSQDQLSGGDLNLVAQQESTEGIASSGAAQDYTCRSGMVSSAPGFNFTYGLVSITAKIPYAPGLWPALWLAASSHQWPPELDIMEHWHSEPQVKVYDHTVGTKYLGGAVPTPGNMSAGFHTYSLLWTKSRVTWYIDGVQVYTTTSYVPQQAMYFIANVADDSTAAGACTGTMQIQSVKVWQP